MQISIQPLTSAHDVSAFSSGVEPLDSWLKQVARQHTRKGISRTYVAIDAAAQSAILGYYSLTVTEAERDAVPPEIGRKLPRKLPSVLIGRLAVATGMQGKGVGKVLLIDALRRIVQISQEVGIAMILVDAKDANAARFYEHFGFKRLPDDESRLVLAISTAKNALMS